MDIQEYLLTTLSEEAGEIVQAASKAIRFGLDDKAPRDPEGPTNQDKLISELNDILGVAHLLVEKKILPEDWQHIPSQLRKKEKVSKYAEYSWKRGCLTVPLGALFDGSESPRDHETEPPAPLPQPSDSFQNHPLCVRCKKPIDWVQTPEEHSKDAFSQNPICTECHTELMP